MDWAEDFPDLPPGFRFHPTDEELIVHYLFNKVKLQAIPASVIGEINLYSFDPWDLPNKALFGKDEWFFFTPRDKKYPNGSRPNRSAGSGFWKAAGKDISIFAGSKRIGVKKALAFFSGTPSKNIKTNWIMSEYRLPESSSQSSGSMRLDDWVLCRIRQKGNNSKNISQVQEYSKDKLVYGQNPTVSPELPSPYLMPIPNLDIGSSRRLREIQLMASILSGHDIPPITRTSSTKLPQGENTCLVFENGPIGKENSGFTFGFCDEACHGWIV